MILATVAIPSRISGARSLSEPSGRVLGGIDYEWGQSGLLAGSACLASLSRTSAIVRQISSCRYHLCWRPSAINAGVGPTGIASNVRPGRVCGQSG
jgi:hypothetical protein